MLIVTNNINTYKNFSVDVDGKITLNEGVKNSKGNYYIKITDDKKLDYCFIDNLYISDPVKVNIEKFNINMLLSIFDEYISIMNNFNGSSRAKDEIIDKYRMKIQECIDYGKPNFNNIPKFVNYKVTQGVNFYLYNDFNIHLKRMINKEGLDFNPEFQRGYVWTDEQKIKYIEYLLKGGESGRNIYFNKHPETGFVLVDGKQRLTAVMEFLDDKFPVFGHNYSEYSGHLGCDLIFFTNTLSSKLDVVDWYIGMNTGGTIHTEEDLKTAYEYRDKLLAKQ